MNRLGARSKISPTEPTATVPEYRRRRYPDHEIVDPPETGPLSSASRTSAICRTAEETRLLADTCMMLQLLLAPAAYKVRQLIDNRPS